MKDIDFDELDKAVNSLMATTPADSSPSTAAPAPADSSAVSIPVAPAAAGAPTVAMPSAGPSPQPSPAPRPSAAPAARRGGRFMDMVHASSDMKPRDIAPAPSREGVTISPRQTPSEAAPVSDQPVQEMPAESTTPTAMPDPIDMLQLKSEDTPQIEATPESLEAAATTPDPITVASQTGESPFLADAKVEKRPLNPGGSFEGTPAVPSVDLGAELNADEPTTAEEPSEPAADDNRADEPPAVPSVPELSSDLVAIESNEVGGATQATETADAASSVSKPQAPLGAASIPPQYTPKESSGDQSHAAIYDSSQYPEPMSHPAKHKSGWMWVIWVVLLLGAGAGGAVLLYNFGIIP